MKIFRTEKKMGEPLASGHHEHPNTSSFYSNQRHNPGREAVKKFKTLRFGS